MAIIKTDKARVAIYVRVSTLYQADKDSLPMQRNDLLAYAKLILNTEDCVIFEDAGYSGKNTDRPKYQEMMSMIRAGEFTHLLVWKIDRISRNLLDFAAMYQELKRLGVIFVSKNEQFDTSTAMGEAMLKIIRGCAELERYMTAERVTATMLCRANDGLWNGGRVPVGNRWHPDEQKFTIDEDEAAVVILMHDMYEKMRSTVREARELNNMGYRSGYGNEWSANTVYIILESPFYCGDYRYNVLKEGDRQQVKDKSEWIIIKDHHPAIVSREQKQRIVSALKANSRINRMKSDYKRGKYVNIFSGFIYCGYCNELMHSTSVSPRADGWRYSNYSCPTAKKSNCRSKSTSDPIVGEFVINYILNMVNAQRDFAEISSPKALQDRLLAGTTFKYIDSIQEDGLLDLYHVLASGKVKGAIYGDGVKTESSQDRLTGIAAARAEIQSIERALERLRNLYLYSDDSISEKEFITEREKLAARLEELNDEINIMQTNEWQDALSDENFIAMASQFIMAQKLDDRAYIRYKRLAKTTDAQVLRTFFMSIIDSIFMCDAKVQRITFKNGLSHTFIFKN
ncbi:MAG: recombinase family protein [Lachnospiraceae bacterium]|nr:recombinase family protein [Lachnospiraceae bacterium]